MKIDHLAIWVDDLEGMKDFYLKYFDLTANEKYTNVKNQYNAYFLSFAEGSARIELMQKPGITDSAQPRGLHKGIAHFAIAVGGEDKVNALTERLRNDNYEIYSEPRTTGDGYYESVILDPEGNYMEITA